MGELKDVRQKKGLRMYGGRGGMAGKEGIYIFGVSAVASV